MQINAALKTNPCYSQAEFRRGAQQARQDYREGLSLPDMQAKPPYPAMCDAWYGYKAECSKIYREDML